MSVAQICSAYEAFVVGEIDPLVAMLDPQLEWRGRRRLPRFWLPRPS